MLEPCLSHCTQNWILFQRLFQYSLLKSSQASYLPASPTMVDQRFVFSQDLGPLLASGFQRIWHTMSQMCSHKISWKTQNLSPELQEHMLSTPQYMFNRHVFLFHVMCLHALSWHDYFMCVCMCVFIQICLSDRTRPDGLSVCAS